MLKYSNDYIVDYINENYKDLKIINIDGNGKNAIITLWCGIEGHEYIEVSFKSIINGNIIGCKLCRKKKHILKIKEEVEKTGKKLIEIKEYNEKDYHKSRIIVSCGNKNHKPIETSLNKIINSNVKCKDCIKEENINKMILYLNSTQYRFNKVIKYCESDYMKSTIEIICPKDETHVYTVRFSNFKYEGRRCPHCGMTYGEQEVANILKRYNIKYKFQHKYKDCRFINPLPFDFYLPDYNILIEYDGEQHYKPIDLFGGEEGFEYTKQNDNIKNKYCNDNNIKLIRIPYWDFNKIEEILVKELKVNV